jgi:hypothetical protein
MVANHAIEGRVCALHIYSSPVGYRFALFNIYTLRLHTHNYSMNGDNKIRLTALFYLLLPFLTPYFVLNGNDNVVGGPIFVIFLSSKEM